MIVVLDVQLERDADLMEVAQARGGAGAALGPAQDRQEEASQDGDDRDHHQKFDQRETAQTDV